MRRSSCHEIIQRGDPVDVVDAAGAVVARGLVAYGASELELLRGRNTREIEDVLGVHLGDEAIHRDDLVVL